MSNRAAAESELAHSRMTSASFLASSNSRSGLLALLLATAFSLGFQETKPSHSLAEVLSKSEIQDYQKTSSYRSRMGVMRDAFERYTGQITRETKAKKLERAKATLSKIRSLSQFGVDETAGADPKDFRSKKVKKLEIRLRKLAEVLEDLSLSVPFEYGAQYRETVESLEQLRGLLLVQLFGDSISSPNGSAAARFGSGAKMGFSGRSFATSAQRRGGTGILGDQFTDEEYEKVQDAQELVKRVEVFLEIAEARLDEIERRLQRREWEKKDPNPLEFYTEAQMVHAYQRAIDGIMVNIDEKHSYKLASKKDVRKSLKKLNKKILEFLPRLEPLEKIAIDRQDQQLYRVVRLALKSSEIARKGSQLGLGAPADQ